MAEWSSKLALHFQLGLPPWAQKFLVDSGSRWAKLMDPGVEMPLPMLGSMNWIIRKNEPESVAKAEVLAGAQGAYQRLIRLSPWIRERPWLSGSRFFLEHMNEPTNAHLLDSARSRMLLNAFTSAYAEMLWEEFGIRSVGYCLGTGHPRREHVGDLFKSGLPMLKKYEGLWALH